MKIPAKEYQLWTYNGEGGYSYNEFDTAEETMAADKFTSDWYITRAINKITVYTSFEEKKLVKE